MNDFCIVIDTREQRPFKFRGINPRPATVVKTLKTGDYSLEGFEDNICIERKSMIDLFGSCGKGRDRFEREFKRMSQYKFAALVIENDWQTMYKAPPARSKMDPKIILRTILAWSMRYGVYTWDCPTRAFSEKLTYLMLERFYRDVKDGKIEVA